MAFTKYNKVMLVKYGGTVASHPYISKKYLKIPVKVLEDQDRFDPLRSIPYKQCNTKWKMSRDKKEIHAICPHGIKFILDERK